MDLVREVENREAAIAHGKEFAARIGNYDFEPGTIVTVLDEHGEIVAEIPVKRLHS